MLLLLCLALCFATSDVTLHVFHASDRAQVAAEAERNGFIVLPRADRSPYAISLAAPSDRAREAWLSSLEGVAAVFSNDRKRDSIMFHPRSRLVSQYDQHLKFGSFFFSFFSFFRFASFVMKRWALLFIRAPTTAREPRHVRPVVMLILKRPRLDVFTVFREHRRRGPTLRLWNWEEATRIAI